MKKLIGLFLLSMALVLLNFTVNAQIDKVICQGNSQGLTRGPIPGASGYHYHVHLFTAAEVGNIGKSVITTVAFRISTANTNSTRKMKIYLKEVSETSLDINKTYVSYREGATLVFDETNINCSATGWRNFDFSTNFPYSGSGSLLLIVEGEGCALNGGCGVYQNNSGNNANSWFRTTDNNPPNITGTLASMNDGGTNSGTTRFDTRITYVVAVDPLVITQSVSGITTSTLTLNGEYHGFTPSSAGFKYNINGGSWQFAAANTSPMSYTVQGLDNGYIVNYCAFGLNGTDTLWGDELSYQLALPIAHVTLSGAGFKNGTSWANAFPVYKLQDALLVATDEVRIAGGEYTAYPFDANTNFKIAKANFTLSGAWDTETNTQKPASVTTILRAQGNTRVLLLDAANPTLRYLTITGGNTNEGQQGGGISITANANNALIENCIIAGNRMGGTTSASGSSGGAGIYVANANTYVTINSCLIVNNECATTPNRSAWGAGVCVTDAATSNTTLNYCTIAGNLAGGSETQRTGVQAVKVYNCILWGNGGNGGVRLQQGYNVTAHTSAYPEIHAPTGTTPTNHIEIENVPSLFINPSPVCGYDPDWANYNWHVNPTSVLANSSNREISPSVTTDIIGLPRAINGSSLGVYENSYDITLTAQPANQGTVQIDDEQAGSSANKTFLFGETCQIKAIPEAGYQFENWTEADTTLSTETPYTLSSIHSTRTITANFLPVLIPVVTTDTVSHVDTIAATIHGSYINISNPTFVGFKYKKQSETAWTSVQASATTSPFSASLTSLADSTVYEYKAIVTYNTADTLEGNIRTFTTLKKVKLPESISPREADKFVSLYPNPNHGSFTINISSNEAVKSIEIFNLVGQTVYSIQNPSAFQINLPAETAGIFFVKVATASQTVTKKMIVE